MAKTKKISKLKDDSKWAWLMLAPNIIGFLLFMLIPMVATFVLSFTKFDMLSTPKFVGLQNYIDMAKDPIIWEVTKNTILYTVITVPVGMCISLLLAVMLDQKIAFRRFYRAAFFLPSITSMVVVAIVWQWIYNLDYGLLNYFLSLIEYLEGADNCHDKHEKGRRLQHRKCDVAELLPFICTIEHGCLIIAVRNSLQS